MDIDYEMYKRKNNAIRIISKFVRPNLSEQFAQVILYAWMEGSEEAETLAYKMDLDLIDFCAIEGNHEDFRDLLLKEFEMKEVERYA